MLRIDHVQLAIPTGAEDLCRTFYVDLLGMHEKPKPPVLAARGGLWLTKGLVELHLGVEAEFRPARKAHPAFLTEDIDALATRLQEAGAALTWDNDLPVIRRFYVSDPVGNRLEFIAG